MHINAKQQPSRQSFMHTAEELFTMMLFMGLTVSRGWTKRESIKKFIAKASKLFLDGEGEEGAVMFLRGVFLGLRSPPQSIALFAVDIQLRNRKLMEKINKKLRTRFGLDGRSVGLWLQTSFESRLNLIKWNFSRNLCNEKPERVVAVRGWGKWKHIFCERQFAVICCHRVSVYYNFSLFIGKQLSKASTKGRGGSNREKQSKWAITLSWKSCSSQHVARDLERCQRLSLSFQVLRASRQILHDSSGSSPLFTASSNPSTLLFAFPLMM